MTIEDKVRQFLKETRDQRIKGTITGRDRRDKPSERPRPPKGQRITGNPRKDRGENSGTGDTGEGRAGADPQAASF